MAGPFVFGIAGGLAPARRPSPVRCSRPSAGVGILIEQDHFYLGAAPPAARGTRARQLRPSDALELDLLIAHLDALRAQQPITRPTYDFAVPDRAAEGLHIAPARVIVEGHSRPRGRRLRARFDAKVYVDTDADIRLMRRVRRDLEHRGRSFARIRKQYHETVRPMHFAFVGPNNRFADVIVPEGGRTASPSSSSWGSFAGASSIQSFCRPPARPYRLRTFAEGQDGLRRPRPRPVLKADHGERAIAEARASGERVEDALLELELSPRPTCSSRSRRTTTSIHPTEKLSKAEVARALVTMIPHRFAEKLGVCPVVFGSTSTH